MTIKYVLVVGTLTDGYEFWGPYETTDDAVAAAERHDPNDWGIVPLHSDDEELP